jgi:hypothetical protein
MHSSSSSKNRQIPPPIRPHISAGSIDPSSTIGFDAPSLLTVAVVVVSSVPLVVVVVVVGTSSHVLAD